MRINDVKKLTGLSKRTLYYYIEEQLISPCINPDNGYYIFSEDDVNTLHIIQCYRKMNFSIKEIRALLAHPNSIHIYLKRQVEKLEVAQAQLIQKISYIKDLDSKLHFSGITNEIIATKLEELSLLSDTPSYFSDSISDAKLVSLYLWGPFLQNLTMTDYRKKLWKQIVINTNDLNNPNITILKQFLYSLPAAEIEDEFAERNLHIEQIARLTVDTLPNYIQQAINRLKEIPQNPDFITYWKSSYHNNILPTTILFDSEVNALVRELSPQFLAYYDNIHHCCSQVY